MKNNRFSINTTNESLSNKALSSFDNDDLKIIGDNIKGGMAFVSITISIKIKKDTTGTK